MNFIVDHAAYEGMPGARDDQRKIDWTIPSNRRPGTKNWDGNARRRRWWEAKADDIGIPRQGAWLSKAARAIHPTGEKPCQICGRTMSIEYVYPTRRTIAALNDLLSPDAVIDPQALLTVQEIAAQLYGSSPEEALGAFARVFPLTTGATSLDELVAELESGYVQVNSRKLSPGSMSNAPDRLDGFHTYNLCHRGEQDTGRSSANLSSYGVDRRAYEQWCEGDWAAADELMSRVTVGTCQMPNCMSGSPVQLTADHVGPISLGFKHTPWFIVACRACNSAKGNRMSLNDIMLLLEWEEATGESAISWQGRAVWDSLKNSVHTDEEALRLSRLLRINQHHFLAALSSIHAAEASDSLIDLLSLQYAANRYEFVGLDSATLTYETMETSPRQPTYALSKQARMVRIAFDAVREYSSQGLRNVQDVRSETEREAGQRLANAVLQLRAKRSPFRERLVAALALPSVGREAAIAEALAQPAEIDAGLLEWRAAVRAALTTYMMVVGAELIRRYASGTHLRPGTTSLSDSEAAAAAR